MRGRSPALSGNRAPYTQGRMSFPSPPELLGGIMVRRLERPIAIPATPVMAKSTLIIVFIGNTPNSWPSGFRSGTKPARPSASRATPITIETAFMGDSLRECRGSCLDPSRCRGSAMSAAAWSIEVPVMSYSDRIELGHGQQIPILHHHQGRAALAQPLDAARDRRSE